MDILVTLGTKTENFEM